MDSDFLFSFFSFTFLHIEHTSVTVVSFPFFQVAFPVDCPKDATL